MFTIDLRSYNTARLLRGRRSARIALRRCAKYFEEETWSTERSNGDDRGFVSVSRCSRVADSSSRVSRKREREGERAHIASRFNESRCDVVSYLGRSSYVNRGYITSPFYVFHERCDTIFSAAVVRSR